MSNLADFVKNTYESYRSLDQKVRGHIATGATIGLALLSAPVYVVAVPAVCAVIDYAKGGVFNSLYQGIKGAVGGNKEKDIFK
jgi:hypothetical protein